MISCRLLLCAQGVVRDAEHGGISVFNILEGIQVAAFPMIMQLMDIFAVFQRTRDDAPEYELLFRVSIGETELLSTPFAINFEDKLRNRSVLHVQGLVVPHPGTLIVSAALGENILQTYEVNIEQITPPQVEVHQEPAGERANV